MRALLHEFRIAFAGWLLHRALDVMPSDALEAKPLSRAVADYDDEAKWIARWEKFPA